MQGESRRSKREQAWWLARLDWLAIQNNQHTRRAYARALDAFSEWADSIHEIGLWQVQGSHAQAWRGELEDQGLAPATISQRIAAVSGFYAWVASERPQLLVDGKGRARANPWACGIERPRVPKYERAQPLTAEAVSKLLGGIERASPVGARDYALLLTFLATGWKSGRVLEMRVGDLAEAPPQVAEAVRAYLRVAGKSASPVSHIWTPLAIRGARNFLHATDLSSDKPISSVQAANIFHKRLRRAGLPDTYPLGSLRHTHTLAQIALARADDLDAMTERLQLARSASARAYLVAIGEHAF